MSFSNDVKTEILENKPLRVRFRKAQAYGLFLFARHFNENTISMTTESEETAKLYAQMAKDLAGKSVQVNIKERSSQKKTLYEVSLPKQEDRLRLLAALGHTTADGINRESSTTGEEVNAFLGGVYLACGSLTDPAKSYHLEFVVRDPVLLTQLAAILDQVVPGVRESTRRGAGILYYKECAQIEDLLAAIGASKASLAMIEVEIFKGVRNKANRVTNCETANIDKLVKAASSQIEDIQFIISKMGEDWLPESLRAVALLRLANPELSLRQLAEEIPGGISRSGMHHRLDKLSKLAEQLRLELEPKGGA